MPRSNRYLVPGHTYHVTHRCHNKSFLLKFAKDRQSYLDLLRRRTRELPLSVINYAITSNHIHLLIKPDDPDSLSLLLQLVAGEMAQIYNGRKHRSGAFWQGRFHSTMIENGTHLWNCMHYIDLNMVRAKVVPHPRQWKFTGYHELLELRKRYGLIDLERVLELTGYQSLRDFRANYEAALLERLSKGILNREPWWTESLAVGGCSYLESLKKEIPNRWAIELVEIEDATDAFVLRESAMPYASF